MAGEKIKVGFSTVSQDLEKNDVTNDTREQDKSLETTFSQDLKIKVEFSTVSQDLAKIEVTKDTNIISVNNEITEKDVVSDTARQDKSLETVENPTFIFSEGGMDKRGMGLTPYPRQQK